MSDERQSVQESTADYLSALKQYGPEAIQAITGAQVGAAKNQLAADQAYIPGQAQLQTDVYAAQAPRLNQIGAEIDRSNQLAGAETQNQLITGAGGDAALAADALQRKLDPGFYTNRDEISGGISKLLGSMDPSKLSGSEQAAVERGLGRTEGYFTPSALTTARNAMTFGDQLANKQSRFGQAISTAAGSLPTLKSGISGYQVATGKTPGPNTGDARFSGVQSGVGSNGLQVGSDFMQNVGANQRVSLGQQKSLLDNVSGWGKVGGQIVGSVAGAMM